MTDNGPQYVTWRGKGQFSKELEQQGIRQVVSRPRHPQTLGKIERFWGTLWRVCLQRAVFLDLEDARRRIGLFIDHYNFQRQRGASALRAACLAARSGSQRPVGNASSGMPTARATAGSRAGGPWWRGEGLPDSPDAGRAGRRSDTSPASIRADRTPLALTTACLATSPSWPAAAMGIAARSQRSVPISPSQWDVDLAGRRAGGIPEATTR